MRPATDPPQPSAPLALAPRLRRRRSGPGAVRRALKHPRVMPYQRLIALVLLANLGVLLAGAGGLADLAALTLANLAGAVLIRQQHVLNVLFGLAGRGSTGWPLWLRWSVSKVEPRRRAPRRLRARGHGVAVRVHGHGAHRARHGHHPRRGERDRAPLPDRRRRRAARRPAPRPQRVRAQPPLRRLERGRAVLGPHAAPRPARRRARRARDRDQLAGLGARARHAEHRRAVAAAAARPGHDRAPVRARRDRHRSPAGARPPSPPRSGSAAARCASGTPSPP